MLIVRDEEAVLDDCLSSLDGLADEIVVMDTGSADRSVEIATSHGARVARMEWTGDFAAARNAAIELANREWILSIDADERVTAFDRGSVDLLLAEPTAVAGLLAMRPAAGTTRYRELRLFRNHPALRYVGRFHEDVAIAVTDLVAEGWRVFDVEIALDHVGYDGDLTAKHERDLPLVRAHLEAFPQHAHSWRHLGMLLAVGGDHDGAEAAWRRAIEIAADDPPQRSWLPWGDLLVDRRARGEPVEQILSDAAAVLGDIAPLRSLRADDAMDRGEWAAAAVDLEALVANGIPDITDVAIDQRIYGDVSWLRLGICRFQLGDASGAADAFRRADELHPSPETRARLAVARAAAAKAMSH